MVQTETVAKDKTFNLRLDEQDRKRLDEIAKHYSAPAATAIRMLVKEKYDQLELNAYDFMITEATDSIAVALRKGPMPELDVAEAAGKSMRRHGYLGDDEDDGAVWQAFGFMRKAGLLCDIGDEIALTPKARAKFNLASKQSKKNPKR